MKYLVSTLIVFVFQTGHASAHGALTCVYEAPIGGCTGTATVQNLVLTVTDKAFSYNVEARACYYQEKVEYVGHISAGKSSRVVLQSQKKRNLAKGADSSWKNDDTQFKFQYDPDSGKGKVSYGRTFFAVSCE